MHLVIPVGQNEQQPVSNTAAREGVQELETRFIAPMQILYREQNRLLRCYAREEMGERDEEAAFFLFWTERSQLRFAG
jgi:hypothetical protein